ncbi:MAG: AzlD domain-containing protein [Oscillospiraceae bacterium]
MTAELFLYILVMAGVTYIIRMLPMVLFRKKIKSKFIKSILYYTPYAVLGAMTFPAIFYSTGSVFSASAGLIVALVLAFFDKSMVVVALAACAAAYIATLLGF